MKIVHWSRVVQCGRMGGQLNRQTDGQSERERERERESDRDRQIDVQGLIILQFFERP